MWLCSPRKFKAKCQAAHEEDDSSYENMVIHTNNVVLYARTRNIGDGRPLLLFLHGFPETSYSWRHQIEYFGDIYEVAALDMRGYGESQAPSRVSDYAIDKLCLDVCSVIRACGHESCFLIGHDWGGMVAWNVAANFSEMIKGLVTICSPHPLAYEEKQCFTLDQAKKSLYFLLFKQPWLPEVWLGHMEGKEIDSVLRGKKMGVLRRNAITLEDSERIRASLARQGRLTAALNYYRSAMGHQSDIASKFVRKTCESVIQVPTLQMYADCDGAFCPSMFENSPYRACSHSSTQTLIKLENCSHWAQQDRPDMVNKYIHTFIKETLLNSSSKKRML